jgi:hypothetical protein
MKFYQEILDLGYKVRNDIMGLYTFDKQVGDNVVGYFEVLEIDTRSETYMIYKNWGGSRKALPLTFVEHVAITKFLKRIGLIRYE